MQQHFGWSFYILVIHSPLDKRRPCLHIWVDDFNTFILSPFHEIKILLKVNRTTCQDSARNLFFHPCAANLAIQFTSSILLSKFAFIKICAGDDFRCNIFVPNKHFVRCPKMSQKCEFSLFASIAFKLCTFSEQVFNFEWSQQYWTSSKVIEINFWLILTNISELLRFLILILLVGSTWADTSLICTESTMEAGSFEYET